MSRKTQLIETVGQYLHVYNRGVNHEQIFFSDSDYSYFLDLMAGSTDPASLKLHAFTLMPNHYHIVVSQHVPRIVSSFLKKVCERYAVFLNRKRARSGHLFQGRFRAKLVSRPSDLLYLSRYIHLNPVVPRLVTLPEDWKYGSCSCYCNGNRMGLISTTEILDQIGGPEAYREYLHAKPANPCESIEKCLIDQEFS